jgi:copper chaperone CopZ
MKKTTCAPCLLLLPVLVCLISGCAERPAEADPAAEPGIYAFKVEGMHCGGCERSITEAVGRLDGITVLEVSHSNGVVRVESDGRTGPGAVVAAIEPLGYSAAASPQ